MEGIGQNVLEDEIQESKVEESLKRAREDVQGSEAVAESVVEAVKPLLPPPMEYVGELTEQGRQLWQVRDAPIKASFRAKEWRAPVMVEVAESVLEQDSHHVAKGQKPKKNPWLGNRPGMVPRLGPQLCHMFAEGRCPWGEKCKFSHDIAKFLSEKPPNIGVRCHIFETFGFCSSGIKCRFSAAHIDADNANIMREEIYAPFRRQREAVWPEERIVLNDLQKGKVHLDRAKKVLEMYSKRSQESPSSSVASGEPISKVQKTSNVGAWAALEKDARPPLDLAGKLYLAPLTTIGNLPFRRLCVDLGCDVTCGEMAVVRNVLAGQKSEWVLMKRHPSEKIFGVQFAGNNVDEIARAAQLAEDFVAPDFIDLNCGCPIDLVTSKGMGSALLDKVGRLRDLCIAMSRTLERTPFTIKVRTGKKTGQPTTHKIFDQLQHWGCAAITMHGRSREQRYTKEADWEYIADFARKSPIPVIGNGDVWDYSTFDYHMRHHAVSSVMFARGAIIKPWVFTEVKERRHWDISSGERLDILRKFCNYGMEHWGSDWEGVEKTRNFLLQTLSFLHRYIPLGVLERYPVEMYHRPVPFVGRDDLETLMASPYSEDWVRITEMLLGTVPAGFSFEAKHQSNSYSASVVGAQSINEQDQDEW